MVNLSVLDPTHGDFNHSWNPNDAAQVQNAHEMFDNLKKAGYMIYETKIVDGTVTHDVVHIFEAVVGEYHFEEPKDPDTDVQVDKQLTAHPAAAGG